MSLKVLGACMFLGCPVLAGAEGELLQTLQSPNEVFRGWFGLCVSGIGDVNHDGRDDVVIGAPEDLGSGMAYVFSGMTGQLLTSLVPPDPQAGEYFGCSVSGAGDVNNDGYPDILVGAWNYNTSGIAYVYNGHTGSVLRTLLSPAIQPYSYFGYSVSGAGDVNGDGYGDLVVGAKWESAPVGPDYPGRAHVYDGRTGGILHTLVSPHQERYGEFGCSVSGAGDVDADGFSDLIVGAEEEDTATRFSDSGRAYVFSGRTGSLLFTLESPNESSDGSFGYSVSDLGDVNQDGCDDVAVGALFDGYHGHAYVFDGKTGELLHDLTSPAADYGLFGNSVSGAGDVDHDGYCDVLVGDRQGGDGGRAYVFSGQTWSSILTLVSPNEEPLGHFGYSVSGAGDTNGDGYDDIVVGAIDEGPGTSPDHAGRAYVMAFALGAAEGPTIGPPSPVLLRPPSPNPAYRLVRLVLDIAAGGPQHLQLSLHDCAGRRLRRVLDETVVGPCTIRTAWEPVDGLAPGLYWWCATAGERGSSTRPMLRVR